MKFDAAEMKSEDFSHFLTKNFLRSSHSLDQDPIAVKKAIETIMTNLSGRSPSQDEMDSIFECSATLGFTIWQHFAAVKILSHSKDWIKNNPRDI